MYCKRLNGKFQFTIRPTVRYTGAGVFGPLVLVFSKGTGAYSAYSDTSLDSGHLSDAQTIDITRLVGSPRSLLPGPSAGILIATSQRKYCFSESAASNAGSVGVL
ncbi:MAG: hypothetical protein ABFD91_03870 [Anaerohalosphaeraceae bacterium]